MAVKTYYSVVVGGSADPKGDLKRADELVSRALALDPNYARAHSLKGGILSSQGRLDESIAEYERALALDPAKVIAGVGLGADYQYLGQYEKSLDFLDKAIRLSPHDPALANWHNLKALSYFGLKQYDQAIESARRAIAINPNGSALPHLTLIAALGIAGHEVEAHEVLQRYVALVPNGPKTIAAWKAIEAPFTSHGDPRFRELDNRRFEAVRKAGMPEE